MARIILALSFGKPSGTTANQLIAKLAQAEAFYNGGLIVADASISLKEDYKKVFIVGPDLQDQRCCLVKLIKHIANSYIDSGDLVVIISEPIYSKRLKRDLEKILEEEFKENVYVLVKTEKNKLWYDKKSTQIRTRYEKLSALYELLLRILPWELYKKISRFVD
ncbi:MAG: hypothetical protein WCF93_05700 [Candidatus Moraniibacteriota bacterium]